MKRFRSAVRYNIIYQLVVGSFALIGLVFLIHNQGTSNLRAYIMALSNSWGLILVVIFMGYGMVDVPRRLWHKGDNARELRRIAFKASVVKDKCQDTEDEVLNVAKVCSNVFVKMNLLLRCRDIESSLTIFSSFAMTYKITGTVHRLPQSSAVRPSSPIC